MVVEVVFVKIMGVLVRIAKEIGDGGSAIENCMKGGE